MLKNNPLKRKLKDHQIIISAAVRFQNPALATIIAKAGVDNVMVDNEHFPFTSEDIKNIAVAVHNENVSCTVRVGEKDLETIYRVLDMGVDGILLPNVETAEEAQLIVDAAKYPPFGRRGCCPITIGADYGIGRNPVDYYPEANDEIAVGLMIESKKGYENLDEIMKVKGIDFFAIGPSDFSGSFGKPGQAGTDPEIKAAMADAYKRMIAAGYTVTSLAYTPDKVKGLLADGKRMLNIGSDVQILTKEFAKHIKEAKEEIAAAGIEATDRPLWEKIRAKEPVMLPYLRIADPGMGEIMALSGIEAMVIDDEHFPFDDRQLVAMIRAVHSRNSRCLVRVHDKSKAAIGRVLDMGADGIIAPQVRNYEEAMEVVKAVKYGPVGNRGFCPIAPGASFGFGMDAQSYAEDANKRTIVGIMVETKSAVEDLDRILSIKELDYISVGPSDLSASYGYPGEYDNPVVKAAMREAWDKIEKSHVALSGQCYQRDKIGPAVKEGKSILNIGSDLQYMIWGFNKLIADVKEQVEEFKSGR